MINYRPFFEVFRFKLVNFRSIKVVYDQLRLNRAKDLRWLRLRNPQHQRAR